MHEVLPPPAMLSSWDGTRLVCDDLVELCGHFCPFYVFVVVELLEHLLFGVDATDLLYLRLFHLIMLVS
jgi:hypothetical protein